MKAGRAATPSSPRAGTVIGRPLRVLRPRLMAALDGAVEHGARVQRDRELGQADLFGGDGRREADELAGVLPDAPAWTEMELLDFEKEALGLYLERPSGRAHAADLQAFGARTIGELAEATDDGRRACADGVGAHGQAGGAQRRGCRVGGIVSAVRPLKTRKGDAMAVFTLEDHHGTWKSWCFPRPSGVPRRCRERRARVVRGSSSATRRPPVLASEIVPIGACASGSRARWRSRLPCRRTGGRR